MNRLFEDSFVRPGRPDRGPGGIYSLPVDAYVTDEEVVVTASVPGMDPNDLEITLDGDILTIKGEIGEPSENIDYVMQERFFGPVSRSLSLGVPVKAGEVEATIDNGILTVLIPKAEEAKLRTIKVKAKA
jgi:HSP20 family protein